MGRPSDAGVEPDSLPGVAFLPYPTTLLGAYIQTERDAPVAAVRYASTAIVIEIGFIGFWIYAVHHGLVRDGVDPAWARATPLRPGPRLSAYLLVMVVAFFSAPLSLALISMSTL